MVVGADIAVGVGKGFGVDFGADEFPVGAGAAREERVDAGCAGASTEWRGRHVSQCRHFWVGVCGRVCSRLNRG